MARDQIRDAIDSLRRSLEGRMARLEAKIDRANADAAQQKGVVSALKERVETLAVRSHAHAQRLTELLLGRDQGKGNGHDLMQKLVTWDQLARIVVVVLGALAAIAGFLFFLDRYFQGRPS